MLFLRRANIYEKNKLWLDIDLLFLNHKSRSKLRYQQGLTTTTASMECSQSVAWTSNRSLFVPSRVKVFPGKPTNSGSTLPRPTYLEDGVICVPSSTNVGSAPASPDMRSTPPGFVSHAYSTTILSPTQPTIAMTNYTHMPTVMTKSAFYAQLQRFWGSSSGACGNSTTATNNQVNKIIVSQCVDIHIKHGLKISFESLKSLSYM